MTLLTLVAPRLLAGCCLLTDEDSLVGDVLDPGATRIKLGGRSAEKLQRLAALLGEERALQREFGYIGRVRQGRRLGLR